MTGAANSTWDLGAAHTLSLQTTANGPITTGTGLLTQGGSVTFSGTSARVITGPTSGGLTINDTGGALALSTTTTGTLSVTSAGVLTLTGASASTWDIGNNTLSLQTTANGPITTGTGLLTQGGNITFSGSTARTITGPGVGGLTVTDATGALTLTGGAASTWDIGNNLLSLQATNNGPITTGTGLLTQGGNVTFSSTSARTITGPTSGGLTINDTGGALTLSTTTTGTLSVTSAGILTLTGAANSTWDIGNNTLSLQTTNNGAITTGTGLLTQGGNITFSGTSARTITGPTTGGLTIDASAPLSFGNTNATSLSFGSVANNASTTFKQTASATAFQVQNASSKPVLTVDTSSNQVVLGQAGSGNVNGQLVFANNTNTNTATLTSGVTSSTYSVTLPTAGPASTGQCLQSSATVSTQLTFSGCGGTGLSRTTADTATVAVTAANNLYVLTNSSSAVASGVLKIDNGTNTSSALSVLASANAVSVAASAVPSADQVSITNAGQAVTAAGVNGLNINYVGGSAAVESAGAQVDLTPGGTSGGTWSGMRIVANGTGAVSGVNEDGIKVDGPATPGAGTETGLYVGTGWDIGLDVQSGDVNLAGFTSAGSPSDPATPAASNLAVYAKKVSGRMMLKIKDPSGQSTPLQPALWGNNVVLYAPTSGATVTGGFGTLWAKGGGAGTVTTATPATTAPAIANQIHRTKQPNVVTTTNQDMGIKISAADGDQFWTGNAAGLGGFFFQTRFVVDAWPAATDRIFAGLASGTTSVAISDTLAGDVAGLWHDTTDSSTTFNMVTRNNVTTTKTAITVSNAIAAGNAYDFYMYCQENCTTIFYRLDDIVNGVTYEGSTATTLPRNTIFMGPQVEMSNGTANTVVNTSIIGINRIYIESDH